MKELIIRISCKDEKGLVHKISEILLNNNFNIIRNDEFVDKEKQLFFMRTEVSGDCSTAEILRQLKENLSTDCKIEVSGKKKKNVVILATKEHHCLSDLLIRNHFNELNFNVLAVISNHEALKDITEKFGLPFHFVSTENISRDQHEDLVSEKIKLYAPDFVILAKYMRILSKDFVQPFANKIINIHHSFLPAFVGAKPYHQAFERGVKIIGATAHFVTNLLDEGPIIYQDVAKVSHSQNAPDLAKLGRDVERIVLANALKLVFEDKVFIDGNKTVIFE